MLQFPLGTEIKWSCTAATGYTVDTSQQTLVLTEKEMTLGPVGTIIQYNLTITFSEGDESITVTIYGNSTIYMQSTTIKVNYGTYVSWTAKLKSGYQGTTSGSFTMTGNKSIITYSFSPYIAIDANDFYKVTGFNSYRIWGFNTYALDPWTTYDFSNAYITFKINSSSGAVVSFSIEDGVICAAVSSNPLTTSVAQINDLYLEGFDSGALTVKFVNWGSQGSEETKTYVR